MSVQIGDRIRIESFKHGNRLHRIWKASTVLKLGEPIIVANHNPEVIEADETQHTYPGLAICLFSQIHWFHPVIIFDAKNRIEKFYIDIASPYQWDRQRRTIQYVDYDLDLIVQPDFSYVWVDEEEYEYHQTLYQYPNDVKRKIAEVKPQLEEKVENQEEPFTLAFAYYWSRQYLLTRGR